MDFVSDQHANGRRFRVLNVVVDFSREMVSQLVSVSIGGRQMALFLEQLCKAICKSHKIICDNGTVFTSKAMFIWRIETAVSLGFIQPGKPIQPAFLESLDDKFRN